MNLADEKTQPSIIDIIGGRGLGRNEKHLGKLKKNMQFNFTVP